jgi:THO complex subunit 1
MQSDDSEEFTSSLEVLLSYLKDVTLFTVQMVNAPSPSSSIATNPLFHRLPHTLLSDVTSTLPISTVQKLWSSLPSLSPFHPTDGWSSQLCHPTIFNAGTKMTLLRTSNHLLKQCSNRDVDAEFAGSIMTTLSMVMPLSERSAMNVLGSFNVENGTRWEDAEEFERGLMVRGCNKEHPDGDNAKEGKEQESSTSLGYEFYSTFWRVQQVFTDPPSTILSSTHGYESLESFLKDIKSILTALESTPPMISMTSKSIESNQVPHYKYLTSSQLLHLQLKDPELRTHLLTQLLILLSHLQSSSGTLPTPTVSTTPGANPAKLGAQLKSNQQSQLIDVEKRTQQLLSKINSDHLRSITWIFKERESMWRNWKKNKCAPPLEREDGSVTVTEVRKVWSGRKRKIPNQSPLVHEQEVNLKNVTSIPSSSVTLDSFLEPYIEACDPEAEVDAEYHPANDSVYSWRALRLMAKCQNGEGQLHRFGKLRRTDGNFEGIVRDMWKNDRGIEIPGTYVDVTSEEDVFRRGKRDETEDTASVGTPEVDEEAKKEKMEEFEKAALDMDEEMLNEGEGGVVEDVVMDEAKEVAAGDAISDDGGKAADETKTQKEDEVSTEKDSNQTKIESQKKAAKEEGDTAAEKDDATSVKPTAKESDKKSNEPQAAFEKSNKSSSGAAESKAPADSKGKAAVKSEEPASADVKKEDVATSKESKKADPKMAQGSSVPPAAKSNPVKEEQSSSTKLDTNPASQASAKKSNGGKDSKPTVHSVKPKVKFTPKEQIRQKQLSNVRDGTNRTQTQQQERPRDSSTGGSNQGTDVRQERRGSDSHRGPTHQQLLQRGGRFGSKDERPNQMDTGGNDNRDKRGDGYHNTSSQGRGGRGSWQPPPGRGRGRESNRGPRDDRRGGRGRR